MKKYQIKINNMKLEIIQDDDGKFITPYLCIEDWGKFGTALKPSFEPIIVARKPFKGSLVDNVIEYGVGGINIDECRVGDIGGVKKINIEDKSGSKNCGFGCNGELEELNKGRFPANTILTYDETDFDEVCGGFPNNTASYRKGNRDSRKAMFDFGSQDKTNQGYTDSGSASRYFYCAKASKKDRDEGLENFTATTDKAKGNGLDRVCEFCGVSQLTPELCHCETKSWITKPRKNTHPTVKPTELMQYLVRLVNPNGATILDPFNGSGSTGKAVMYENKERNKNYKYIGIELTEEYLPISKARIECLIDIKEESKQDIPTGQTNIFDFIKEE
jgi:site-specific DNA-methyltransferase (adenine-specific)